MKAKAGERRKVNVPVGEERRGKAKDRRRCPDCGSALGADIRPIAGGTRTTVYCMRCDWKKESKQVDEAKLQASLGFEAMVLGNARKPLLELDPRFLKAAGIKPGDSVSIEPLYSPGGTARMVWVVKPLS